MAFLLTIVESILALLGGTAAILTAWFAAQALTYQTLFGPNLERDLGFREGKSILPGQQPTGLCFGCGRHISDRRRSLLCGRYPCAGDVLPDESHTSLFKKLHRHRGRTVELAIVDGGPGPPFHERPRRFIRVVVPAR